MGTECHYFICDVGNREEVYQTAKAVREKVSAQEGLSRVRLDTRHNSQREHSLTCLAWERALRMAKWLFSGHVWGLSRKLAQAVCACPCA